MECVHVLVVGNGEPFAAKIGELAPDTLFAANPVPAIQCTIMFKYLLESRQY
jgi:hypothetical protein